MIPGLHSSPPSRIRFYFAFAIKSLEPTSIAPKGQQIFERQNIRLADFLKNYFGDMSISAKPLKTLAAST